MNQKIVVFLPTPENFLTHTRTLSPSLITKQKTCVKKTMFWCVKKTKYGILVPYTHQNIYYFTTHSKTVLTPNRKVFIVFNFFPNLREIKLFSDHTRSNWCYQTIFFFDITLQNIYYTQHWVTVYFISSYGCVHPRWLFWYTNR